MSTDELWSADHLAEELKKDTLATDAVVARGLAERMAAAVDRTDDPLSLAEDVSATYASLAAVVRRLVEMAGIDESDELWAVVGAAVRAAAQVDELNGAF